MVHPNTPFPDADADAHDAANPQRLQALFDKTTQRGLRNVQVSIENDCILLSGTVRSYYLKQMAQEQVRKECPTTKLSNDVVVQPRS